MPLYRHSLTGNEATLSAETVSAYAGNVWELVADESPEEEQARLDAENTAKFEQDKVDVEDLATASPSAPAHAAPEGSPSA
jgi:formylglycine-generating enzyme required for sulfatase activity